MIGEGGWQNTRWFVVLDADGELWCETSNRDEAVRVMRPGDLLYRRQERTEWRLVREVP